MMTHDFSHLSDEDLFARLRRLWRRLDPMPEDLVGNVLVALDTDGLGVEYAMLTLLEPSDLRVGVRGISDTQLLEFSHGTRSVMLRVSDLGDGRRRIDGWIAPAASVVVRLEQDDDDLTTVASAEGRFDFADVAGGRTRMWLQPETAPDGSVPGGSGQVGAVRSRQGFTTEYFTV